MGIKYKDTERRTIYLLDIFRKRSTRNLWKALNPDEPDYVLADSLEEAEKLLNNRGKENDA